MWYVSGNRDGDAIEDAERASSSTAQRRASTCRSASASTAASATALAELQLRDRLGGDPQALPIASRWSASQARLLELRQGLRGPAGAHCGVRELRVSFGRVRTGEIADRLDRQHP